MNVRLPRYVVALMLLLAATGCREAADTSQSETAVTSSWAAPPDSANTYAQPGAQQLPRFSLPTLSGTRLTNQDLADAALVLHFWAPWSRPSMGDLSLLDSLSTVLVDDGIRVVGVLEADGEQNAAQSVVDSLGIRYPILIDETHQLATAFGEIAMLPTTLLIDRDGAVFERRVGAFTSAEHLRIRLRHLAEQAPSLPPESSEMPQAHALTPDRAHALVRDGAAVFDVRDLSERLANDPLTPATPAPLATLAPEHLPTDLLRPVLFVGDTLGTRAQLAAEQALAWGHRRVYFAGGDLSQLFAGQLDG
ncbi:MAG: TlpA disulfide reductase family protein [Bacteroidota bacterium]